MLLIDWRSNPKVKSVNLSFYSQVCEYLYFVKCVILHLLYKRLHTFKSLQWSFGVLLWELATLAQQPYSEIDHADLFSFLKMGYRLSQPVNCLQLIVPDD